MATTLANIRFTVEQSVKDTLDPQDIIIWCNDAQSELLMTVELPSTATIAVTTNVIVYPEPAEIKRINRLWLTSERNLGYDRDIPNSYRIYNGQIIFEKQFAQDDTLNVDFYRHLKYFTAITDLIDFEDRFSTLYTSYCRAQYYELPNVSDRLGDQIARKRYETQYGRYLTMKDQIAAQYISKTQPSTFKEVW